MRDHGADSAFWGYGKDEDLSCINGPEGCSGPVEYRTTPDRTDGKHFARCEGHFEQRLSSAERNLELDTRGRHVDESYAGERYDEDE